MKTADKLRGNRESQTGMTNIVIIAAKRKSQWLDPENSGPNAEQVIKMAKEG